MEKLLDVYYRFKRFIIFGVVVILIIGCFLINMFFHVDKKESIKKEETIIEKKDVKKEKKEIKEIKQYYSVDVKGNVSAPGVYQLEEGSRVKDAINMAGIKSTSDLSLLNLSKKVFDEMVIYVFSKYEVSNFIKVKEEFVEKIEKCEVVNTIVNDACIKIEDVIVNDKKENSNSSGQSLDGGKVSLNKASLNELMTLSGIGESKALLIIDYRNQNNGFKSIDDIKNIKGIGDSIFEKIKDNITV